HTSLLVFQIAELRLQVLHELGGLLRSERNRARGYVATLDHKSGYDSVPDRVVKQPGLAQLEEVSHGLRRFIRKKLDLNSSQGSCQTDVLPLHHLDGRLGERNRLRWRNGSQVGFGDFNSLAGQLVRSGRYL